MGIFHQIFSLCFLKSTAESEQAKSDESPTCLSATTKTGIGEAATPSATDLQAPLEPACKSVAEKNHGRDSCSEGLPKRSEELPKRTIEESAPYAFDPYSPPPKRSEYERKLDAAMHPRRRRHNKKHPISRPENRPTTNFGCLLSELMEDDGRTVHLINPFLHPYPAVYEKIDIAGGFLKAGVALTAAAVMDGVEATQKTFRAAKEAEQRAEKLSKRRKYYAKETAKKRAVAATIQAAIPPPENPRPTPAQLNLAYLHRHDSEAATLHFGRLMIDLEEHERYALQLSGNKIIGVSGGVREWLKLNCPELARHYHTCLRFKRKVQDDPTPPEKM